MEQVNYLEVLKEITAALKKTKVTSTNSRNG